MVVLLLEREIFLTTHYFKISQLALLLYNSKRSQPESTS